MGSIEELEADVLASFSDASQERPPQSPQRKKDPDRLTMKELLERDKGKTTPARTGLTVDEFNYILELLKLVPEPIKRGRKLLDLDIRLVIFMQWICHGSTYEYLKNSFIEQKWNTNSCYIPLEQDD